MIRSPARPAARSGGGVGSARRSTSLNFVQAMARPSGRWPSTHPAATVKLSPLLTGGPARSADESEMTGRVAVSDGNPDLQRGSAEPATSRSLPEWLVVIGVGLFAALVFAIPFWNNAFFYYVGDNPESFVPDWYHFGELLRAGQLPFMDAAGWYGGNYPGEAAYSLWHPVLLLDFVVVSLFDDLAMAAAVVMVEHLALLAMGVFLLAREYGSGRAAAVVVAIGVPATGFTLYYEASGWPAGLAAFTWVTWFWWGARRCSRRLASPLVPFGLGLLAIATGSPYAVLGVLIVLFGIAVELVVRRDFKVLTHLIVTGGCVAAASTLVFLPLLGSLPVTQRQDLAMLANDTFMVPDVGDLAASGSPTYLPSILNWNGAVLERVPSTYFIWFVIPLLPWLHWRGLRSDFRRLASLAIVTGSYGVLVLGPSNVWLFRWPIRLIEYLYLGLGVLFALLLSSGLARDRFRQRAFTSAALVAGGCYLSFAGRPELWRMHVAVAAAVLVLTLGAIVLYLRGSWLAFIGVLLVGTIGVVAYQTSRIPARPPENEAVTPARYVSAIKDRSAAYRGPVLQLADRAAGPAEDETKILLGNLSVVTGHESLNRYSGISFAKFNAALCMDYKGLVCPDSYDRLWRSYPGTDVPLIDALRVQTLVLQNRLLPQVVDGPPAQGWTLALRDETRTIWVRSEPLSLPGRVSWASAGTEVRSANAGPRSE